MNQPTQPTDQGEIERAIETVRKLRRLAARTTSQHEADTATRQAAAVCERYRIEAAAIDSGATDPDAPRRDRTPFIEGGAIPSWKKALLGGLADQMGCVVVYTRRSAPDRPGHFMYGSELVGRPSDVSLAREMFAMLTVQIAALAQKSCAGRGRRYRNSWIFGCARGAIAQIILARIAERERAAAQGMTTALARIGKRGEEAEAVVADMPRAAKQFVKVSNQAYDAGEKVGRTMPIHGTRSPAMTQGRRA